MTSSAAKEAAELKREMSELGADPVADKLALAASTVTGAAKTYGQDIADAIRRQPFMALAIGMAAAYVVGRLVSSVRR